MKVVGTILFCLLLTTNVAMADDGIVEFAEAMSNLVGAFDPDLVLGSFEQVSGLSDVGGALIDLFTPAPAPELDSQQQQVFDEVMQSADRFMLKVMLVGMITLLFMP